MQGGNSMGFGPSAQPTYPGPAAQATAFSGLIGGGDPNAQLQGGNTPYWNMGTEVPATATGGMEPSPYGAKTPTPETGGMDPYLSLKTGGALNDPRMMTSAPPSNGYNPRSNVPQYNANPYFPGGTGPRPTGTLPGRPSSSFTPASNNPYGGTPPGGSRTSQGGGKGGGGGAMGNNPLSRSTGGLPGFSGGTPTSNNPLARGTGLFGGGDPAPSGLIGAGTPTTGTPPAGTPPTTTPTGTNPLGRSTASTPASRPSNIRDWDGYSAIDGLSGSGGLEFTYDPTKFGGGGGGRGQFSSAALGSDFGLGANMYLTDENGGVLFGDPNGSGMARGMGQLSGVQLTPGQKYRLMYSGREGATPFRISGNF